MTVKKHTGFEDANVAGVQLGSDGVNFKKEGVDKVLDDSNASTSDIQGLLNIPDNLTPSDNGKLLKAYYASPPAYGDESDGDVVISSPTSINVYTDMTVNKSAGATVLDVTDSSAFSIGDEVLIHQTIRGGGTPVVTEVGMYEFGVVKSKPTGTSIELEGALNNNYYTASGAVFAYPADKAQVVRVPQYRTLTVNDNITCPAWDGRSGGIIVFRAKTLLGSSNIVATACGYRGYAGGGTSYNAGEGWAGQAATPAYGSGYGNQGDRGPGGSHLTQGTSIGGTGGTIYGLAVEDLTTRLLFGAAGGQGGWDNSGRGGNGGGIILCYVETPNSYSGELQSVGEQPPNAAFWGRGGPGASGSVLVRTNSGFSPASDVAGRLDDQGLTQGGDGRALVTEPSEQPTKQYILGVKVQTSYAGAGASDALSKTAVEEAIAAAPVGDLTIEDKTASAYTLNAEDRGRKLIRIDDDVTIPTGLTPGQQWLLYNASASAVTLITAGVTVEGDQGSSFKAYGTVMILATATDTVLIKGDTE